MSIQLQFVTVALESSTPNHAIARCPGIPAMQRSRSANAICAGCIKLFLLGSFLAGEKSRRLSCTEFGKAKADPVSGNPSEGRKIAYGSFPRWGWPGFTAQVHCSSSTGRECVTLGMAGIHRSSTLDGDLSTRRCWLGMAGIHRSSTLRTAASRTSMRAGDGRDSPLKYTRADRAALRRQRWGWPGFTAQVHYAAHGALRQLRWGWPGFTAQVHSCRWRTSSLRRLGMAGIHRSSTLRAMQLAHGCSRWGWPGFTAQVHCSADGPPCMRGWGWPGFTAQVH